MGARFVRIFRNFNVENRIQRELSREKPLTAPRHPVNTVTSPNMPNGESTLTFPGHQEYMTGIEHKYWFSKLQKTIIQGLR